MQDQDLIKIVIVDDEPLIRMDLKELLEEASTCKVVAEAKDGAEAIEIIKANQPDIVFMDIRMPNMDGIEAARQVSLSASRRIPIIMLTAYSQPELYEEALKKIVELEIAMTYLTKPMPGAVEITSALPAGTWTIVTSAVPELAHARLNKAGIPIPKELVTSSDVTKGKPDPEPYLVGARKLGMDIKECIVFEDAPNGVLAGKRSGAGLVVGVGLEAMESEADIVVKNLLGISFDGKLLTIDSASRLR